jgi:hypothetical protein
VREQGARTVAPGREEKHWRSKTLEARLPVRKKPAITAAAAASQREFVGGEERIGGRVGKPSRAARLGDCWCGQGRGFVVCGGEFSDKASRGESEVGERRRRRVGLGKL